VSGGGGGGQKNSQTVAAVGRKVSRKGGEMPVTKSLELIARVERPKGLAPKDPRNAKHTPKTARRGAQISLERSSGKGT